MTETADSEADNETQPFRLLPRLDDANREFWTRGEHGELCFWRCQDCGFYLHPHSPRCPSCLSKHLAVEQVSGLATVHASTTNHQPWIPGLDPPYNIAIVELPEQAGLRLTTSIVGCPPADVTIGMQVRVTFEQYDDVWLPFFRPDPNGLA